MNTRIIAVALLMIGVFALSFTLLRQNNQTSEREIAISDEAVSSTNSNIAENATAEATQSYIPYSAETLSNATLTNQKVIIFFHATWCPTCRAAEEDILSNSDQIPDEVIILKADYDSEKELKQKYAVTTQHTFVQIDKGGNEITKWIGGETLDQIVTNIK